MEINRRQFNLLALSISAIPLVGCDAKYLPRFGSCYATKTRSFGYVVFEEGFEKTGEWGLPERGHGSAYNARTHEVVIFARRPGTTMSVIRLSEPDTEPLVIHSNTTRHFYGHGVFSRDYRFLFTTENDFENEVGKIGVYDCDDNYRKVSEFASSGIGPHEIILMPDGRTLVIANGGIITHPMMPRRKLNINAMEPSLCFVDSISGRLIEKFEFQNQELKQLSIRHIACNENGFVIIGMQWEGDPNIEPPILATADLSSGLELLTLPKGINRQFANYVGSVAYSSIDKRFIATSPRGGIYVTLGVDGTRVELSHLDDVCGAASNVGNRGFLVSSGLGLLKSATHKDNTVNRIQANGYIFDNHMISFPPTPININEM